MLTENFILRATKLHNSRYDYDIKSHKIIVKDIIDVICHEHGTFKSRVSDHLYHESGCPECARILKSGKDNFIDNAKIKYGIIYDYSKVEYINNYTPVEIICKKHGSFNQQPSIHLKSAVGCSNCDIENRTKTITDFKKEANVIHNNFYNYDNVEFLNTKSKVEIICPLHGDFWQISGNHLAGNGCPVCGNFKRARTFNSNRHLRELKKSDNGTIYLVEFSTKIEKFIKIGITTQTSMNGRFGNTHRGYKIKKLFEKSMLMVDATNIERDIIKQFDSTKYTPRVKFGGYTECFVAGSKNDILNYITARMK